jgi:NADH-quinone oxidoreductase subunit G
MPLHQVFGTEELSARSAAIAERTAAPHLSLAPDDARRLGVADGGQVELTIEDDVHWLPVHIEPALTGGTAGLPAGRPGLAGLRLPAWGGIRVPDIWQQEAAT